MKVCIVGAGAIGGLIGARLAAAGVQTAALARGATIDALQRHGWQLDTVQGCVSAPVRASGSAEALGAHDLVVIAVKAPRSVRWPPASRRCSARRRPCCPR
jgi:2-dehydropantoate 2-reductase